MSLQFISNSVLRGDASFSTGSAALFQSSGNNTSSDTWIYNSGSLANGYQLDFGHGIVRTSANIIMTLKDENVGIGTTSPLTKLQITAANASSPTANIFLDIDGSNTPGMGGQIIFGSSTSGTLTNYIARIQGVRSALDNGSSDLHFQTTHVSTATGPTTKMTILSDGNVGIGTTSPSQPLEVHSTIKIGQSGVTGGRLISADSMIFQIDSDNTSGSSSYRFRTNGTADDGTELMRIQENGNVGIGTNSPAQKLHIKSTTSGPTGVIIENTNNAQSLDLDFWSNAGAVQGRIRYNEGAGSFSFFPNASVIAAMEILYNGNVGIGDTSPSFKLDVNVTSDRARFKANSGDANIELSSIAGHDWLIQSKSDSSLAIYDEDEASERMRLTSAGALAFGGATAYGTSGQVLTSAGNATPTWTTPTTGTVTGTGTAEYIPKWNSTSALVNSKAFQSTASSITTFNIGTESTTCDFLNYQDTTGAISGKVPIIQAKAALIGIGAQDKTYTTIYEGIKIIPATSHYLTRITPRLEVYPYEDPSTTTDNTYDSSFVGSCFSMGSQNTIGNSTSSNLGIFGFNNTITGDKFVIIGQGNVLGKANVSSLAVGTTNTISGNGKLVNSLLVGQNMTLTQPATRSIVAGINHSFQGAMNNTVIVGSGNQGFGSNNLIWGSSNQGSGINNIMLGGFSCQITSGSGNRYGSALIGWNNTLQATTRATFITGRDNIIVDTDYSIMGGFNNDTSANHSSLLVGVKNYGRGTGNITGGESNTHASNTNNYNLMVGFNNKTYQTGANSLLAGSTNEIGSANNVVVGQNNKVMSNTKNNIVGGNDNDILSQVSTSLFNENNILSGLRNNIYLGSNNIVNGLQNDIGILSNSQSKVSHSIVVGSNNNVGTFASSGVAAKSNMAVFGSGNSARGNNTFVAGNNNSGFADNAIVLGNGNSSGGVAAGENKVIQIGFSIQPNSQSDYIAIGYGITALPTTGSGNNVRKYTAIGRHPDDNTDYDLSSLDPVSFIVGAGTQQNYKRTAIAVTCKKDNSGESNVILPGVGKYRNYTNDTTAAAGGVPIYGLYHTSGTIKIRLT